MSKRKPLDLTKEELDKLRICADYLFFDQYKDMATFSRFEECVGNDFAKFKTEFKDYCDGLKDKIKSVATNNKDFFNEMII